MIPTGSLRTRFYAGTFSESDTEGRGAGRFLENQVIAGGKDGRFLPIFRTKPNSNQLLSMHRTCRAMARLVAAMPSTSCGKGSHHEYYPQP